MPAEELFTLLLQNHQLITYANAYEQLFGIPAHPFRTYHHITPTIQAAQATAPRLFHGLNIQLDALIVRAAGSTAESVGGYQELRA